MFNWKRRRQETLKCFQIRCSFNTKFWNKRASCIFLGEADDWAGCRMRAKWLDSPPLKRQRGLWPCWAPRCLWWVKGEGCNWQSSCWDVSVTVMKLSWRDMPVSGRRHSRAPVTSVHRAASTTYFWCVHLFTIYIVFTSCTAGHLRELYLSWISSQRFKPLNKMNVYVHVFHACMVCDV